MQQSQNTTERLLNPIIQTIILIVAHLVLILVVQGLTSTSILEAQQTFPWLSAGAMLLMFAVSNSIIGIVAPNQNRYSSRSLLSFAGLAIGLGSIAYFASGLSISEAGSYRWIFIVVSLIYIILTGMISLMRNIVDFAQQEEWTEPRIRRKKDKR